MKQTKPYTRNDLIQRYHCVCRTLGMDREAKMDILSGYGVVSSTQLSDRELLDLLSRLSNLQQERNQEHNVWRRRVIAAAASYLELIGRFKHGDDPTWRINYIKGMACRMAKSEQFNGIPLERLRNCYYALVNAHRDREEIDAITYELQIEILTA